MSLPYRVYSPRGEFVESLLVTDGQRLPAGQAVLKLSSLDAERQLAKAEVQAKLLDLAAERLTDSYLNSYVYGPMQALVDYNKNAVTELAFVHNYIATRIGSDQVDIDAADAKVNEQEAESSNSADALEKKMIDVGVKITVNKIDRDQLEKTIILIRKVIGLSTILSPQAGRVQLYVAAGMFVEKGDLLFETSM